MTASICMILGWEPTNRRRIAGVLVAFVGCVIMVIISAKEETQTANPQMAQELVGHSLFFINCLCTSLYVILLRQPLQFYSPLVVTAWAYIIAVVFMALTAFSVSLSESTMKFLCPDCTGTWNVPSGAWFALLYFFLFNSVGAYALLTWANQHATGTLRSRKRWWDPPLTFFLGPISVQLFLGCPTNDCRS
jgi:drug/metabolite transporter (DMT)-like permease